jgi:DNA polymerase III subunit epsilon
MKLNRSLVVFDLETTGSWVEKDRIIEVGMVKVSPQGEETSYVRKVNPQMTIPEEVVVLTGISNQDVAQAPPFSEIAGEVHDFIADSDLGGFSIENFDIPVLKREFAEAGLLWDLSGRKIIDSKSIYHFKEKRNLTAAYKYYCRAELQNAHSALADAKASLEVLKGQMLMYSPEEQTLDAMTPFLLPPKSHYADKDRKFRLWNGDYYITFGKYRNQGLKEILKTEKSYLSWLLTTDIDEKIKAAIASLLKPNL